MDAHVHPTLAIEICILDCNREAGNEGRVKGLNTVRGQDEDARIAF